MNPRIDPYGAFEFLFWMLVVVAVALWLSIKEK